MTAVPGLPDRTDPMELAERRLAWLDRRQAVLATNIANADTPGYRARDLAPFAASLAGAGMALATTDPHHLAPEGGAARAVRDRRVGERTPDGNGVALDEQALKVAETDGAHALAIGLIRKYDGLFRIALGRG